MPRVLEALRGAVMAGVLLVGAWSGAVHAQRVGSAAPRAEPVSPAAIDDTVARAMAAFRVPGIAIGIVREGRLVFAKGYGVREAGKPGAVDADTLFQIGSNTKAFTAAALAILVDEGKIRWDDRVIDHLPEFRLQDAYATREFTIRDLLTHRSGLGEGAGDLMFYPATDMTRAEIIRGLRHLKPVASFRSRYDYDNLLYMVAGQIIPAVTGISWEQFVESRILAPLQMRGCAATYDRITGRRNLATPHSVIDGTVAPIPVVRMDAIGPAGTINCNVTGMAKWLEAQLADGAMPGGETLFSPERSAEMWTVNTIMPPSPLAGLYRTHFSGYGLGWMLSDVLGFKRVSHTGAVAGSVSWVTMVPELKLGIVVLTNQESGAAMEAIGSQILDAYLGAEKRDWVAMAQAYAGQKDAAADTVEADVAKIIASAGPPPLPLDAYAGRYSDAWRGDADVRRDGDRLMLKISRTRQLEGMLLPYQGNIFVVRWRDRSLHADAFVRFEPDFDGRIDGMTMRAVSPATDFSFDFQDLDFRRARFAPVPAERRP